MRVKGTNGTRQPPDRELWRRSQGTDATPDQATRFMELAAFADGRLDDDDTARIAEMLSLDPLAADDVATARALTAAEMAADERVVARAAALVNGRRPEAVVFAFPPPQRQRTVRPWYSAATWSGLAAAIVCAGWLGFDLGSGLSNFATVGRSSDDQAANEIFDPAPLLMRDFTDNSQI